VKISVVMTVYSETELLTQSVERLRGQLKQWD